MFRNVAIGSADARHGHSQDVEDSHAVTPHPAARFAGFDGLVDVAGQVTPAGGLYALDKPATIRDCRQKWQMAFSAAAQPAFAAEKKAERQSAELVILSALAMRVWLKAHKLLEPVWDGVDSDVKAVAALRLVSCRGGARKVRRSCAQFAKYMPPAWYSNEIAGRLQLVNCVTGAACLPIAVFAAHVHPGG